jgi:hypothetical protein
MWVSQRFGIRLHSPSLCVLPSDLHRHTNNRCPGSIDPHLPYYRVFSPSGERYTDNASVIVVPVTLFNKSSSGANDVCRLILNGDAERGGLTGNDLNDARVGCQCALAGAIFDGFSVYCPLPPTPSHSKSDVVGSSGSSVSSSSSLLGNEQNNLTHMRNTPKDIHGIVN